MEFHKFLILRLSAVGDVVRTLPAVQLLKEHYPSSTITWVVEEPSQAFLKSQKEIDEVVLFPRRRWTKGIKSLTEMWGTIGEMLRFIFELRRRKFDVVFDFHGILKSGLLSFLSGSGKRIGYDRKSSKEWNFLFSNVKVKLPEKRISRFQRNLTLLEGIGLTAKAFQYRLHIPPEDQEYVGSFFKNVSSYLQRPLIAIHPGTSLKTHFKRWMPDQYARLADRFIQELDASVLFTWGGEELEWVKRIQREMNKPSFLGPETKSLTQLGEVYRHCDLYVGGDTGPMHIASLMGIPAVVIYGPTDPIENEPFGNHKKVRKEVGCNPCHKYTCKELICIKSISADDVFKATQEILCLIH